MPPKKSAPDAAQTQVDVSTATPAELDDARKRKTANEHLNAEIAAVESGQPVASAELVLSDDDRVTLAGLGIDADRLLAEAAERRDTAKASAATSSGAPPLVSAPDQAACEAKHRLGDVADLVAYGKEIAEPLTDAEKATLAAAGVDVDAVLADAQAWHDRNAKAEVEPQAGGAMPADAAPALDDATIARLRSQLQADDERRAAGHSLASRVHAAVDGIHARHGITAMHAEDLDEAGMTDLVRMAAAMGWSAKPERQFGIVTLSR